MDRHADLRGDVAVAAKGDDAFDEIGRLPRDRKRRPAQLRRRRVGLVERRAADQAIVDARVGPMHHRRLDAVGPGAPVFRARGGERGARNLLGIEAERRPLRRVAADRQRAGNRLGDEMIAEARLIRERRLGVAALWFPRLRILASVLVSCDVAACGPPRYRVAAGPSGQLVTNVTNIRLSSLGRKPFRAIPMFQCRLKGFQNKGATSRLGNRREWCDKLPLFPKKRPRCARLFGWTTAANFHNRLREHCGSAAPPHNAGSRRRAFSALR